ncbi:MAG TPA: prolipoprotein diacylglyceryl transferase family protein [Puia sp.]|nr:prolipoprotein diacylglyceryl transferase family protein [Puia sp.]
MAVLNIKLFNKKIKSFHFFGVLGFICGTSLGIFLTSYLNLHPYIIFLMTLVGAATFFLLAFAAKIITGEENIVYYHHEIAILIFCSITLKLLHYPVLPYLDIIILGIGTFLAFGRIGCFNVGCCHGKVSNHGVVYSHKHVEEGFTYYYEGVSLLPVQLIESAFVFCVVITGSILLLNHIAPGTVLIIYTVVYGAYRFGIEFFRGDPERPYWKGLSEAQWTTLILVAITLLLSVAGLLPFYDWHLIIFLLLVIASCYIIFIKNKDDEYRLLNPAHIHEIASALQIRSEGKNNLINIYETYEGLSISSGYQQEQNNLIQYYTLSGDRKLKLNQRVVEKIASIIRLIKKHKAGFEIVEKQNGIYHIIFTEKNYSGKATMEMFVNSI